MAPFRALTRGLRALLLRRSSQQDLADEVAHYLEQDVEDRMRAGLSREAALRQARLDSGGALGVQEAVRSSGWEHGVETLLADLRLGLRKLRAAPGFTCITVLTLALGVGATTAIFSAVHPILLAALPYPDAGRIVALSDKLQDGSRADVTFGSFSEIAARSRSIEALAVYKAWQPTLAGLGEPERLEGQQVSWTYFGILGIGPARGQDFQSAQDRLNAPSVAILSDGLWRRRFGADPALIGKNITLNGVPVTVVGIMPRGFENVTTPMAQIWRPLQYDMSLGSAWGHHLKMLGRLRPGSSIAQATSEIQQIAARPLPEFARPAWANLQNGLIIHSLQGEVSGGIRGALLVVLGAALLVLLIACVNVTNLLLGRGVRRRGEFALRTALGAGQGRLVRQVLTESLLLALLGGTAGVAVASLGVRALVALSPPGLPRLGSVSVHGSVLLFALGLVIATALGFGLFPALQASAADPQGELSLATLRSTGGPHRARGALVVVETALAVVLLVSSGLLLRSLTRLFAVQPGFAGSQLLTLQVQTSGPRYAQNAATLAFFARALDAVRQVPGVASAAFTSQLPLSGETDLYGVHFEPSVADDPGEIRGTYRYAVSDGYVEAMGIPLKRGRLLTAADRGDAPPVALISESLARRRLAGRNPLGQQLRIGTAGPYTVVGVVGDVKQASLAFDTPDAVYLPEAQWRFADNVMSLVVRMRPGQKAARLVPQLLEAIWATDRDQPIVRVAMMDQLVAAGAAERRFAVVLIGAFALTALLLAAAGIYGVLAGSVAERTRELGIRAALGASQGGLLTLVIRQGMTLTLLGAGLGVLGALAATRVLTTMLFGISRLDVVTYVGGVVLLAAVALVACGLPAFRASRLDPAGVLRSE